MSRILHCFFIVVLGCCSLSAFSQVYSGTKTVNASRNMSITIRVDVQANEVEITMTGNDGAYFAYGFGSNFMTNSYTIVTQGPTITERKLGNHNAGSLLSPSFTSSNYVVNNGVGTSTVTRAIAGADANYFTFPTNASSITIIWGAGSSNTFVRHNTRGSTTITLTEEIPCQETTSNINATACDSYTSPSGRFTYTSSGNYKDTVDNKGGCDSIINIALTINQSPKKTITTSACEEYISTSGNSYTTSGTYTEIRSASGPCDSIITLNLDIQSTPTRTIQVVACNEYTSRIGENYDQSGVYIEERPGSGACDSLITLDLTINEDQKTNVSITACDSLVSPSGRFVWKSDGVFKDTLQSSGGCDSVLTVRLTLFSSDSIFITETLCDTSYTSPSGQYTYFENGEYRDTIQNEQGCPSYVFLNLSFNEIPKRFIQISACDSYTSLSGTIYDSTGVYSERRSSGGVCDSIITYDVTIITIDTSVSEIANGLSANAVGLNYQWLDCNDAFSPIPSATEQSFIPATSGLYAVEISNEICKDTSDCRQVNIVGLIENQLEGKIDFKLSRTELVIGFDRAFTGEVMLLDGLGKKITSHQLKASSQYNQAINIGQGVFYLMLITESGEQQVSKILVQ